METCGRITDRGAAILRAGNLRGAGGVSGEEGWDGVVDRYFVVGKVWLIKKKKKKKPGGREIFRNPNLQASKTIHFDKLYFF